MASRAAGSLRRFRNGLRSALFMASHRLRLSRVRHAPLVLNVEPTNHCNLRCPMCPVSQQAAKPHVARGMMDLALAAAIADEVAAFRPLIAINMGGESTLHPQLVEMVGLFKRAGCYVFLDTNATRLTPELSEALVCSGLDELVLCLDGDGSPESYQAIRVRADFDRTVAGIRAVLRARSRATGSTPRILVKNIQHHRDGLALQFPPALRQLFREHPPDGYRATWADYWPGDHADGLTDHYDVEPYVAGAYTACTNLWKKLAISWDGKAFACCLDLDRTTYVGDVREQGVLGVWHSERMVALRAMHRDQRQAELDLCARCTMIQRPPRSRFAGLLDWRSERFTPFADEEAG